MSAVERNDAVLGGSSFLRGLWKVFRIGSAPRESEREREREGERGRERGREMERERENLHLEPMQYSKLDIAKLQGFSLCRCFVL